MIPLKDNIPTSSFPLVTVGLIGANIVVFLYQLSLSFGPGGEGTQAAEALIFEFGLIPCRVTALCRVPVELPSLYLTVFSSMFLHGGLFHIAGNMLYLWIFGNNVEDSMGSGRFVVFYLLCGVVAAAAQTWSDPGSRVPMIGASGAISGILGAYLLLYPHARVLTLVTFGFFWSFVQLPAVIVIGLWAVVQFLNGLITFTVPQRGGVAVLAHVGGFVAGLLLIHLFRRAPRVSYRF